MEVCFLTGFPLVAGLIIAFTAKCTDAVECYVCSWSPSGNSNDYCSTGNFDPLRVQTLECENGCETIAMKDTNGELEMFYRNCITNEPVTYDAIHRATKLNDERVYTCDSRLCNAAPRTPPCLLVALGVSFLLLWVARSVGT